MGGILWSAPGIPFLRDAVEDILRTVRFPKILSLPEPWKSHKHAHWICRLSVTGPVLLANVINRAYGHEELNALPRQFNVAGARVHLLKDPTSNQVVLPDGRALCTIRCNLEPKSWTT